MPKDETNFPASEADVKVAIGKLISAGISNLGKSNKEFFDKLKLTDARIRAWNKVLSGERYIDQQQARHLSKWIKCGSEYLSASEWLSLVSFPDKVPEQFYPDHEFDFSEVSEGRPNLNGEENSIKTSTSTVSNGSDSAPRNKQEVPVADKKPVTYFDALETYKDSLRFLFRKADGRIGSFPPPPIPKDQLENTAKIYASFYKQLEDEGYDML